MDQPFAASLVAWTSTATAEQLQTGPTAADLGGLPAVAATARQLADSPLFPYLVDIAGHETQTDQHSRLVDEAVLRGVAEHARYTSYLSATTRLTRYPTLTTRLGKPLERALQQRAEAGTDPQADPATAAIGATALEIWLQLCTTQTFKPHRLLTLLTELHDTVTQAPTEMTKRLPRVAGLAHEHFPDEDLITLLHRLTDIPEAEADAGFETALADLRSALDADNQDHLVHGLAQARTGFAAVEATDEVRHDARAYAAALDAIMAFQNADTAPLRAAAHRLRDAVNHHRAWLSGGYLPPWAWARSEAETAWLQLTESLEAAADPLTADCWYHPSQALAAFRDAYQAARAFAVHVSASGDSRGVELLIRPVIESAFIQDKARLALLDHALTSDPAFAGDQAAERLHLAVHEALRLGASTTDSTPEARGRDGLGKVLSRLPAVLHHFGIEGAIDLVADVPPRLQEVIETLLWNNAVAEAESGNIKVERKLDEIRQQLATSPDWLGVSAGPFMMLLKQTLLFLVSRHNIGATMGGQRTAYLKAVTSTPALEKPFHQDYNEWLSQGPIYNAILTETINRGRGRADVLVKFRNASFCVECKRETDDASEDSLRAYAGQAAVYTDTDTAFAILLVLDLTTPPTGSPDLYSSVWVEKVQREGEQDSRYIIIACLPGGKPDPSSTRTPPRRDGRRQQ